MAEGAGSKSQAGCSIISIISEEISLTDVTPDHHRALVTRLLHDAPLRCIVHAGLGHEARSQGVICEFCSIGALLRVTAWALAPGREIPRSSCGRRGSIM